MVFLGVRARYLSENSFSIPLNPPLPRGEVVKSPLGKGGFRGVSNPNPAGGQISANSEARRIRYPPQSPLTKGGNL